jgi:hypothetical protein
MAQRTVATAFLCAMFGVFAASSPALAAPVTIDFRDIFNNPDANGEIDGTEFLGQGLLLEVLLGSTFNMACSNATDACLAADLAAVDDFEGAIQGTFVDALLNPITVSSLDIDLCCSPNGDTTVITFFDANDIVLATFFDSDASMSGFDIARFEVDFSNDGIYTITYDVGPVAVPEPSSVLLLGTAALFALARRRRAAGR